MSKMLERAWESEFRSQESDFTRAGPLSPELIVTLLLFMAGDANRRGYRHLLEEFWDQAARNGVALPVAEPVSAPAFCLARRKLAPALFDALLDVVHAEYQAQQRGPYDVGGTYRLMDKSAELHL